LLLGIINDLLDLSKIEAGKFELTPVKYETASLINDTMMLNMAWLGSMPVEFMLSVDENVPATLLGDELRIKQIANNLLSNAFKYTKKGEIKVSFGVEETAGGNDSDEVTLVFKVADTGVGMTDEQISMLFDEYTRFNMAANRTTQGTGLGMNITRTLLNMMRGEIFVTSAIDVGSEFTVRIPQKKIGSDVLGKESAENLQMFRAHSANQITKSRIVVEPMPYGKILIVDDVASNLYVAKGLMGPYKLDIATVMSGFDAIEKIKDGNVYDIVFMDHMMPYMDGIEATKIMRELGYDSPIVALTANAVVGQADVFLTSGFNAFVSKPIDMRELNIVLKKFIRDKQPPEVLEAARRQNADADAEAKAVDGTGKPSLDPALAEIFLRDASTALTALEELCGNRGDACAGCDMQMYVVIVHGMKSSLANIGEKELSAVALTLEQAGREKNIAVMEAETPSFMSNVRLFMKKLTQREEIRLEKATENDLSFLRDKLLEMQEACGTYDTKIAKDIVTELRKKEWPGQVNEMLKAIAEHLLRGYFEKATDVAGKIIQTV
jgi:CheY-like chemotaxis protein